MSKSLSDESSVGSPRHRTPSLKSTAGEGIKGMRPWWAEEEGELAQQSFLKSNQKTKQEEVSISRDLSLNSGTTVIEF